MRRVRPNEFDDVSWQTLFAFMLPDCRVPSGFADHTRHPPGYYGWHADLDVSFGALLAVRTRTCQVGTSKSTEQTATQRAGSRRLDLHRINPNHADELGLETAQHWHESAIIADLESGSIRP